MLEGYPHGGPHTPGGTAADGVDYDHRRLWFMGDGAIDLFGRTEFLHTQASQFLAHGNNHQFWIHVRLRQMKLPVPILSRAALAV